MPAFPHVPVRFRCSILDDDDEEVYSYGRALLCFLSPQGHSLGAPKVSPQEPQRRARC